MFKNKKIYSCIAMCLVWMIAWQGVHAKQVKIHNVPIIYQYPELPTGCEATSLTMLLRYYGVEVTKEQVARSMPKAPRPTYKNGRLYAESPNNAFIGDPFSKNGFGVYAPVILKMIDGYLPGKAEDLGGGSFQKVYDAIDEGRPVMLWTTIGMLEVQNSTQWVTPNGSLFTWKIPEHAVVMTGYDDTSIYINDPYTGSARKYSKSLVEKRWVQMGKQAVAIKPLTNAYEKVPTITTKDVSIEGIRYTDLVREDEHGEWIPTRFLSGIHGNTQITYNQEKKVPNITVKEDYPIASNMSKWFSKNSQGKKEAIPVNINRKYYIDIPLDPNEKEIITYNVKGRKVMMHYKVVDGTTYVSREWVEKFYDIAIKDIK